MKSAATNPESEMGHWLSGSKLLLNPQSATAPAKPPDSRSRFSRILFGPVLRTAYWTYRLMAWGRRMITRRFERAGLGVAAALAVSVIMVPDTENNVAYQGFTVLLFTLGVSSCFVFFFRGRFSAGRRLPRFGTVGRPLQYSVTVENLTGRTQAGLKLLEDFAEARPSYREWLEVQLADDRRLRSFRFSNRRRASSFAIVRSPSTALPAIPPNGKAEVKMELVPLRRGLLRLSGLTLARPDPLGLVRAFTRVKLPQSVLVLPKRYPMPPIALPGAMKYQQGGVALASSVGQSEEFVALRDYRHGDPVRHIHWRSWAKASRPVVKEFEDEFFVRHALVLDTFTDHPRNPAFEEAVAVAASFACTIQTQESLLDLLFVGPESYVFTAGRGLAHADQMLEILALVRTCAHQPFSSLEHLVLNHIALVSGCVCVMLSWDEQRRSFVRKLQSAGVPVLVLVIVEPGERHAIQRRPDDPDRFYVLESGQVERGLMGIQ